MERGMQRVRIGGVGQHGRKRAPEEQVNNPGGEVINWLTSPSSRRNSKLPPFARTEKNWKRLATMPAASATGWYRPPPTRDKLQIRNRSGDESPRDSTGHRKGG